jgi:hypothetical protein
VLLPEHVDRSIEERVFDAARDMEFAEVRVT